MLDLGHFPVSPPQTSQFISPRLFKPPHEPVIGFLPKIMPIDITTIPKSKTKKDAIKVNMLLV